jgi:nucleoid-associated protein YgaU
MAAPEKAQIRNLETNAVIKCMFNPTEYATKKSVNWSAKPVLQNDVPEAQFGGGQGRTLTMKLFFDAAFDLDRDLLRTRQELEQLTVILDKTRNKETDQGRPPFCLFTWGTVWEFKAVVTQLDLQYTLFKADGTPLRFTANMTLMEIVDPSSTAGTNPTSYSKPGFKRRQVLPGETLAYIAYEEYRDSGRWRAIAEANSIEDPLSLTPGQSLAIPVL